MPRSGPNPLQSPLPLAAAPMAGGASTVRLAAASAAAGAFPFLAAGYQTPAALAGQIGELRGLGVPFGVNLFAANVAPIDEAAFRRYARQLQPEADAYGLDLSQAPLLQDDDGWQDKLDLLLADPVPVVSVTFGLPSRAEAAALRRRGSRVLITVTTVEEARAAAGIGADALIAQGSDAGGHSATFDPRRAITAMPAQELTRAVIAATGLPVVATGGVDGGPAAAALLHAGAACVAVGTLLLRAPESGASATHKDALADPAFTGTVITRAFTGRPARGLGNQFIERHEASAPVGYPAVHHLTRGLRQAAAAAGDPQRLHLWAGSGYRNASADPAGSVIGRLASGL
jgi:NAD(P)H-dependent flavin oxidoreductase YrpB (nitropropane dioxygenase family)